LREFDLGGPQSRRQGTIRTVIALIEYMRDHQAVPLSLLKPACELVTSLNSLNVGVDDPMFSPARAARGGRTRASPRTEQLMQVAAVAVSVLRDGLMAEDDANRYVANALGRLGRRGNRGQTIAGTTVGNWWSTVTADLPNGIGLPGKADDPFVLNATHENPSLYLLWWRRWRKEFGEPHLARTFVDRVLVPDMKNFLDPA
jgi:hypothetical protein